MNADKDAADDQEANFFAMHLLVPTYLLMRELAKMGPIDLTGEDGNIKKLAKIFGVSETVIVYRIAEEKLRPS